MCREGHHEGPFAAILAIQNGQHHDRPVFAPGILAGLVLAFPKVREGDNPSDFQGRQSHFAAL